MAIDQVNTKTKFSEWMDITNEIIVNSGDLLDLTTIAKDSLVNAVNELDSEIGVISTLTTTNKDDLVSAVNELDEDINDIGDITTLTTTDKSNTVNAINEHDIEIGDVSTLTTTDKDSLVDAINELDANLIPNPDVYYQNETNGRFATETGIIATTFDSSTLFTTYNTSTLAEGHKFIDDNNDNGGSSGAMSADAVSLTTFLGTKGRTELRYGFEFFILNITGGAGVNDGILENGTTYYPLTTSSSIYLNAIGNVLTWSGYIKNDDAVNDLLIGNADCTTYIDGISQANPYELTLAEGWVHVIQTITLTKEYYNLFPAISGLSTSLAKIALSGLYRAENLSVQLGVII